jgi:hypothetical protein
MTLWPALLVAAAVSGTVDLSDRSELRVRDSNEPIGPTLDLETTPAVTARLRARAWALELGYAPRFLLRQIDHGPQAEALHSGSLGATYRFRGGEVSVRSEGSYGTQSFTALTAAPDASGALPQLPGASSIGYVSSRTSLAVRWARGTRLALGGRAEYALAGGADAVARALVPLQHGPAVALDADVALTRTDHLVTTVSFAQATFSPGPDDLLTEAQVAYRARSGRRTDVLVAAGAAVLAWRAPGAAARATAYPVAEAGLLRRFPPQRLEAGASLRLAPVVSWLSGVVDERLQGNASLTWTPTRRTTVRALASVAQTVPPAADAALTLVLGEAAVALQANHSVRLEAGTRGAWQSQRGAQSAPPQWVLFLGATFVAPTLRF